MFGAPRLAWAALIAVSLGYAAVNAGSDLMEAGGGLRAWEPWLWELSSVALLLALFPLIAWAARAFSPARLGWPRAIAAHLGAALGFSLVHVAGMFAIRFAVYGLVGQPYSFGDPLWRFLYEFRKDGLTYVLLVGFFHLLRPATPPTPPPAAGPQPRRLEVRDGARRLFLAPPEIAFAESAGNYVELHTEAGAHLMRTTLASLETALAEDGFVRVHRSRLVNRAWVQAIDTNDSGDFTLTLKDGRRLAGSRRWRDRLDPEREAAKER